IGVHIEKMIFKLDSWFKWPFNIPPLSEQKRIVTILSTWDKAISVTEKLLTNSQQQKKALMQQLLTGKKRIRGFWDKFKKYHLSEIVKIDSNNLGANTLGSFKFKYISLSDVKLGKISQNLEEHLYQTAPSRARRVVHTGDILLSTVRPGLQGFALVTNHHNGCIASTGFAVLTPQKGICGDYIYHCLFSSYITEQIDALVVGTNYPAINSSDVASLSIYCPSFDEQVRIAAILNNCDAEISTLEKTLACLKDEKKALMQQLLTGNRRVSVQVKVEEKESVSA
ncbi:TPA: restriction endonuclease subunit S, partial [Citrobacter freundii]|nr:restriction endonuclease subunit S [Citrobacter freundii]